jgi:hypothetical protein
VWRPDYAVPGGARTGWLGWLALGVGLLKELGGQAEFDRAVQAKSADSFARSGVERRAQLYVDVTEHRYRNVRRCC